MIQGYYACVKDMSVNGMVDPSTAAICTFVVAYTHGQDRLLSYIQAYYLMTIFVFRSIMPYNPHHEAPGVQNQYTFLMHL